MNRRHPFYPKPNIQLSISHSAIFINNIMRLDQK